MTGMIEIKNLSPVMCKVVERMALCRRSQLICTCEEEEDLVRIRMVNNSGVYSLGVGVAFMLIILYTIVLAVAGWQVSFFNLVLIPILSGVLACVVVTNTSPLEEWVVHRDGTAELSLVGLLRRRQLRLEHVTDALVEEVVYSSGEAWGMVSRGKAVRLALQHAQGLYSARTLLALEDERPMRAAAAINHMLGDSEAMATEASPLPQPTLVLPPLQQACPVTTSVSPVRPDPSPSSARRPPFASHRRKDARLDFPLPSLPTTPVFGATAFGAKPAQLDMDLIHGKEEAKESEEQGTQSRAASTWESSRV